MSTAITNVRVFDGEKLTEPKTVVIENGLISEQSTGETIIDGSGCTLIPGLIDSHVHIDSSEHLKEAAKSGVTTMFEMANFSPKALNSFRNQEGLTDIIACCYPATAEHKMSFPEGSIVKNCGDAERYVKEVSDLGADFIKIIIEDPTANPVNGTIPKVFTKEVITAIVDAAHKYSKLTVAHVTTPLSYKTGIEAGVDILTHTPLGVILPQPIIDAMAAQNTIDIPTMVMMQGIASKIKKFNPNTPIDFQNVISSVKNMHEAGITILAGTDANDQTQSPYQLPHGKSLHDEFDLLVEAGFTPTEVLQSATSLSAKIFRLNDRGVIEPGFRADLVMVEGDPTTDIKAVRSIRGVWISGVKAGGIGETT